jgi:hypothetical protein
MLPINAEVQIMHVVIDHMFHSELEKISLFEQNPQEQEQQFLSSARIKTLSRYLL